MRLKQIKYNTGRTVEVVSTPLHWNLPYMVPTTGRLETNTWLQSCRETRTSSPSDNYYFISRYD